MTQAPSRLGQGVNPTHGILMFVAAVSIFPMLDAIAKTLAAQYPVVQITWARYSFQTLALVAYFFVFLRHPFSVLRTRRLRMQVLRGSIMIGSNLLFISGLKYMPLADATAILFVSPLLVAILSVPLLGETVGLRRWIAIGIGLVGMLIVIRPGLGVFGLPALFPFSVACLYAVYQITTRSLAATDHPYTTIFYTSITGLLAASVLVPFDWVPPTALDWGWMAVMGGMGVFGHFILIKAFDYAEASALAPYNYFQIVSSVTCGYLVFGDFPDSWTFLGAGVIVASGLYVAYRERMARGATRNL
ncbi:MAG: DMT family transporter [Rhodospirillaceae bacterium]|jgi:drug/metabolite transporter (DMT)-like permease|nr:DMT family transporter [Rhodospirillaceae bacterium]MBT6117699.1 DMT family transporter [Rhodospirillaceae bacterium]